MTSGFQGFRVFVGPPGWAAMSREKKKKENCGPTHQPNNQRARELVGEPCFAVAHHRAAGRKLCSGAGTANRGLVARKCRTGSARERKCFVVASRHAFLPICVQPCPLPRVSGRSRMGISRVFLFGRIVGIFTRDENRGVHRPRAGCRIRLAGIRLRL